MQPDMNAKGIYSIGTQGAVNGIIKHYPIVNSGYIAINIATIIRNYTSQFKEMGNELAVNIGKELVAMTNEITQIMTSVRSTSQPVLLFYLFDYYRMLDQVYLRDQIGQRAVVASACDYLLTNRGVYFRDLSPKMINGVSVNIALCSSKMMPHDKLETVTQNITTCREMMMVSSYPVDWHVRSLFKNFVVVNSFTGELIPTFNFPEKVFGEAYKHIPFYPDNHFWMGDKNLLDQKIKPSAKRKLEELAEKENWLGKSKMFVTDNLTRCGAA